MSQEKARELERVKKLPVVRGKRALELLGQFWAFPWAQDTVFAAAQLEEVLMLFLQRYMGINGEKLRR